MRRDGVVDRGVEEGRAEPVGLIFLKMGVFGGLQRKWQNFIRWRNQQESQEQGALAPMRWVCVVPACDRGNAEQWFVGLGLEFEFVEVGDRGEPSIWQWLRIVRRYRPRTVLEFRGPKGYRLMLVGWLMGVPSRNLWAVQEEYSYGKAKNPSIRLAIHGWITSWTATRISVLGSSIAALFYPRQWKRGEIDVLRQPFDISAFPPVQSEAEKHALREERGLPLDRVIVGYTGRKVRVKNIPFLIRMMRTISQQRDDVSLLLIGKKMDDPRFVERARKMAPNAHIIHVGQVLDVEKWLQCMDYFVFPSFKEGQPFSILEAMACEIPVLASHIPASRFMMPPESHEYLFDPHQPEQAASTLLAVMNGTIDRSELIHRDWLHQHYDFHTNHLQLAQAFGAPLRE